MTEDEAKRWIEQRFGEVAFQKLLNFANVVTAENAHQNLVSAATMPQLWARHIVDSAQLVDLGPKAGTWLDIGTGAGFPGLVVAVLRAQPTTLCEPRRLRADFLKRCVTLLGLSERVTVVQAKVEGFKADEPYAVISARAVAPLIEIMRAAQHLADRSTGWILPKGRSVQDEVALARRTWQGEFHVEQSVVDPQSGIVVARKVARR